MKKLLFILLFLPILSFAQDSSEIKISISVQARDIEFVSIFIAGNESFEELWDNIKVKFRQQVVPAGNDVVVMDTVSLQALLNLHGFLNNNAIAVKKNVFSRFDLILRATNQSWLISRINETVSHDDAQYSNLRLSGRNRLRRTGN